MRKYSAVFRLSFIHTLRNYKGLIGLSLFLIVCLIIFAHLWQVTAARMGRLDLSPVSMLWYIALNEWVLISLPDLHEDMQDDLKNGRLAYLLPRPMSYVGSVFAEGLGILSANLLVLGIVSFGFTYLRIEAFPFTFITFLTTLALAFLAGCVGILFKMLIGMTSFWIHQVEAFHWIFEKFLFVFGGLMLPLFIYPDYLQTLSQFTPFPGILGGRSALVIHFTPHDALAIAGALLFWILLGSACLKILYRRGLRIVNIEGG